MRVGRAALKWHHCHSCGVFVAWLCNPCNLTLTEHALEYWDALAKVHDHACHQPMALPFDVLAIESVARPAPAPNTRQLYMSNGGGDERYISTSTLDGFITVEQLASILGINANTARDIASGRNNGRPIGQKIGGAWFIPYSDALAELARRWGL